jgi:hypothetical protein
MAGPMWNASSGAGFGATPRDGKSAIQYFEISYSPLFDILKTLAIHN